MRPARCVEGACHRVAPTGGASGSAGGDVAAQRCRHGGGGRRGNNRSRHGRRRRHTGRCKRERQVELRVIERGGGTLSRWRLRHRLNLAHAARKRKGNETNGKNEKGQARSAFTDRPPRCRHAPRNGSPDCTSRDRYDAFPSRSSARPRRFTSSGARPVVSIGLPIDTVTITSIFEKRFLRPDVPGVMRDRSRQARRLRPRSGAPPDLYLPCAPNAGSRAFREHDDPCAFRHVFPALSDY